MGALVIVAAALAAEAPKPEVEPRAPAAAAVEEPPGAVVPKPAAEPGPAPSPTKAKPAAPPGEKVYFYSTCMGASFPFSGGMTTRPEELRFDWPAFVWGIECGMDMPCSEVRLSFDSRRYNVDHVGGKWTCDQLLLCGGWRVPFGEVYEFAIGGGAGVAWDYADHAFSEPIHEDSQVFAWRLYSCLRYSPPLPVEFELWGRLTFAKADYETYGTSGTQDLSAGEFGLAVRGRF